MEPAHRGTVDIEGDGDCCDFLPKQRSIIKHLAASKAGGFLVLKEQVLAEQMST